MFAYVATAELGPSAAELSPPENGITVQRLDTASGRMDPVQQVAVPNPLFLAISASRQALYVVSRASGGEIGPQDVLVAYSIDSATGRLTELNRTAIAAYPAYISLDCGDDFALFASTLTGIVGTVPVSVDGQVGMARELRLPGRSLVEQGFDHASIGKDRWPYGNTSFPHAVLMSPDNRFALVADVGLNRVYVFRLDAKTGALTANDPPWIESVPIRHAWNRDQNPVWNNPIGAGPRHMEFHPNGRWLYVVHEAGSIITVLDYDAERGQLQLSQEIPTLPEGFTGSSSPADIHVHPNGRFLYATNRRHDSIVSYAIDPQDGRVSLIGFTPAGGKNPRSFVITPDGGLLLLGATSSNAIVVFAIDPDTGSLTPNGTVNEVQLPVHIVLYAP